MSFLAPVIEPGFFSSSSVRVALVAGGAVAFTSGVVGMFTVLRRESFAGHVLADVGTTGGSASFFIGVSQLWGFLVAGLVGAAVIEVAGTRRLHNRDLATGIVLGASLGLAALFLYFDTTQSSTTGASSAVLFGSLFVISPDVVPAVLGLSAGILVAQVVLHRMLLLSSLSQDLATVKGVRVRLVGGIYLVTLAIAVGLSALTIGAVLSTALVIGPPSAALRLCKRPAVAALAGSCIGAAATFVGIVLAYDSYYWPPAGRGWPVSFLIVAVVFVSYLVAATAGRLRSALDHSGRAISLAEA